MDLFYEKCRSNVERHFEFAITGQADLPCPFQLIMSVVLAQVYVANHVKVVMVDVENFD